MAKYNLTAEVQESILAAVIRGHSVLESRPTAFDATYFTDPVHEFLFRLVEGFIEKYRTNPEPRALRILANYRLRNNKDLNPTEVHQYLDRLYQVDITNLDYWVDLAVSWAQRTSLKRAALQIMADVDTDYTNVTDLYALVDDARKVGLDLGGLGTVYLDTLGDRLTHFEDEHLDKVPTGFDLLDEFLGGGLEVGELGCILAPPARGKTMTLVNIGCASVVAGEAVFHYSCEMKEKKIAKRYDKRFSLQTKDDIIARKEQVEELIRRALATSLIIKDYPTKTINVANIREHLDMTTSILEVKPALIIVDYLDLLMSVERFRDKRDRLAAVCEDLRGLAGELEVPLWTATQTNRAAVDKRIITIEDLAESFEKAAISDVIIAICQTKAEKASGSARFFVAKNRDGVAGKVIHLEVDWRKALLREVG